MDNRIHSGCLKLRAVYYRVVGSLQSVWEREGAVFRFHPVRNDSWENFGHNDSRRGAFLVLAGTSLSPAVSSVPSFVYGRMLGRTWVMYRTLAVKASKKWCFYFSSLCTIARLVERIWLGKLTESLLHFLHLLWPWLYIVWLN